MKKNNILPFLIFICVSCAVESPNLVLKGVQTEEALLFLEKYKKEKKNKKQFEHYIKHLFSNYAPGFNWSQYWFGIKERALYQGLEARELNQLLSLNKVSCRTEDWSSFANLLLAIAKSDPTKLLFSKQLTDTHRECAIWLSNSMFKSIVQFLSEKRKETEGERLSKAQEDISNKSATEKYIYTEELQKLLINEWSRKYGTRSWSDILTVVDRNFWKDARWISYQSEDKEYLQKTLEMEWSEYQSIENLIQDIFLLFKQKNNMKEIIELAKYKKYFSIPKILNWSVLWESILLQYSKKPENKNVDALLSLYTFSCEEKDFFSYAQLVKDWGVSHYELIALEFCVGITNTPINKAQKKPENDQKVLISTSYFMYEQLEMLLKNRSGSKSVQNIIILLSVYEREKYKRSLDEWKNLINYFSEDDWLNIMHILRSRHDRSSISRILDMHHYIYQGGIPFLSRDIMMILISEEESILNLVDEYGYESTYINNPDTLKLFWSAIKNTIDQTKAFEGIKQSSEDKCDYQYVSSLFQFFSKLDKTQLLFDYFYFEKCADFVSDFREQEWERIIQFIHRDDTIKKIQGGSVFSQLSTDEKIDFVWWIAHVLSFYNTSSDVEKLYSQRMVSKISDSNWKHILVIMLESLKESEFKKNADLFQVTVAKVKAVYVDVIDIALCDFFNQDNRYFDIQKYNPIFILNILDQINWSQFVHRFKLSIRSSRRVMSNACFSFVSQKKFNTLLFILAHSLFKSINSLEEVSEDQYINQILEKTNQIVTLFMKAKSFKGKGSTYYKTGKFFTFISGTPKYNPETKYMSDSALYFYFAALFLYEFYTNISQIDNLTFILNNLWEENAPVNTFDEMYRIWIVSFLQDLEELRGDEQAEWEKKLHSLLKQLSLSQKISNDVVSVSQ